MNSEEREQMEAKSELAFIRMAKAGVDLCDRRAERDILKSETVEQMNDRIELWAALHHMQRQMEKINA